jgi:hypothetical protein
VSFGTTLDRPMLPLQLPQNRFGNQLVTGGSAITGPGCYDNAEVKTPVNVNDVVIAQCEALTLRDVFSGNLLL